MNKGAAGALALILLWIAFAAFFVSFHPGGIRDPIFKSDTNPEGYAKNPVDVIIYLLKRAASGPQKPDTANTSDTSTPDTSNTVTTT